MEISAVKIMEGTPTWDTLLTVGGVIVSVILGVVAITWHVSRLISEEIALVEQKQERLYREIGETMAAFRQKLHEIETWSRDTFIRRETVIAIFNESKSSLNELGIRLEKRLDRIEEKLDTKT